MNILDKTENLGKNRPKHPIKWAGSMKKLTATLAASVLLTFIHPLQAQTLSGSRAAMQQQHYHAVSHGYGFAQTSADVSAMINAGELVRVSPNRHLTIHNVSYPYLRPSVRTLLERLANQYHNACGEKLVATSMTRPSARQPANSHDLSVHPTGMAFDLRIPQNGRCRTWLESTLLTLESRNVLNVIRERRPPHYHVAVFPEPYDAYLASMTGRSFEYVVSRGDTLSGIAARTGTSVAQLRAANGLRGDLINIGQRLQIPGSGAGQQVASVPRELEYQVQPGDTLWRIANRYSVSVDTLRAVNGLAGDLLRVGQQLRILVDES